MPCLASSVCRRIASRHPDYRRFAVTLASSNARLGADADRYSFIVVDLHHLLLAGFDRRTGILEICPEGRLWVESGSATVRLGDMLI
jgi:hypothetical protein